MTVMIFTDPRLAELDGFRVEIDPAEPPNFDAGVYILFAQPNT